MDSLSSDDLSTLTMISRSGSDWLRAEDIALLIYGEPLKTGSNIETSGVVELLIMEFYLISGFRSDFSLIVK